MVLAAMARTDDPRLKELMDATVRHLHAFVRETRPTEEEFETALRWIAGLGQRTNKSHNEVVLAADVLGASTLIDLINNDGMQGETMSALLGPFYRGQSPACVNGDCIARSETPGPSLYFKGKVTKTDGTPIEGAKLDVWQAWPVQLYEIRIPGRTTLTCAAISTAMPTGISASPRSSPPAIRCRPTARLVICCAPSSAIRCGPPISTSSSLRRGTKR